MASCKPNYCQVKYHAKYILPFINYCYLATKLSKMTEIEMEAKCAYYKYRDKIYSY